MTSTESDNNTSSANTSSTNNDKQIIGKKRKRKLIKESEHIKTLQDIIDLIDINQKTQLLDMILI